ncbi:DNA gyrase inhibitor YacG [Caulobacter vibrioides]|uniref:DNA gyrase inhibitor YacG n=1 Tax=Caulobacter vibrioides TaxID=155892 RepID=UPI000BB52011|nr:DNA gyrase inhibitor YacG [Caulobacter vibrioides]ATC25344.1 DNA gyrase inhibitor YacG [Caulobacter vibrioides]AZH13433.1 DNA gyrase inhibitor YacG [Caulobacter vibrioides]PLR14109.1 DNA gyrase inhibitor YacG [Caulobacter vibrioides]
MSAKCPICAKPVDSAFRPFCSKRCADVDLQRWLSGRYVVVGGDDDEENPPSQDINRE